MPNIQQEAQKLEPSAILALFTLDTSILGGPVLPFVMGSRLDADVQFGGVTYTPVDVKFDGLETTGVGSLPTPRISISNADGVIQALVNTYGDLNGCTLIRKRTFARFLDGMPEADPNSFFGPDIYRVERKSVENSRTIEWELSAAIDQEGKMIPGRVVIAGTCMWRYRTWNAQTSSFDYSKAQCPYTGGQSYDINNLPVASALDVPSRTIDCCKKRFGATQPLYYGGFPGVSRVL